MTTKTITPTGGDDYKLIQNTVDSLKNGDTLQLNGNFITKNTIQLKSNMIWRLNGSLKLADNINKWLITEKSGGATKIEMLNGVYDGNKINQTHSRTDNHCVRFSNVSDSHFKDMIIQNGNNDNFTLDTNCHNNVCENITGKFAGMPDGSSGTNKDGNGLADKSDGKPKGNTWLNCVADANYSDNWVIKCSNSIFRGCIGRNSTEAVGFGFFTDANHPIANGNRFEACQAYNNQHSGFSLSNNINKGEINNNFIQGEFYNNGKNFDTTGHGSGIRINNKGKPIAGNKFDIYCHDNPETGLLIQSSVFQDNTGSIVSVENKSSDINIQIGEKNSFDVYVPTGKTTNVKQGDNTINKIDFNCNNIPAKFCTQKYCGQEPIKKYRCTGSPEFQCIEDLEGEFNSLEECQAACISPSKKFKILFIQTLNETKGILILQDSLGEYDAIQACEYVCQKLKEI